MKKLFFALFLLAFPTLGFSQNPAEAELADKYFQDEEYTSALEMYQKFIKNWPTEKNLTRVVDCFEALNQFEDAEKFLQKWSKRSQNIVILPIRLSMLYEKTGKLKQADKLFDETLNKQLNNQGHFVQAGAYLFQEGKLAWALQTYLRGRKVLKSDYIYATEIANLYQQLGENQKATEEYLNFYYQNANNINNAKLEILNLVNEDSQDDVEKALIQAVDRSSGDRGLREMLYEFYVLVENFYEAFVQVKSIDRLFKENGAEVYQFAETMRNNKSYDLSNKAFDYLIDRKKNQSYYYQAHLGKAVNGELKAFDQLPVDLLAVKQAVEEYENMLKTFGRSASYFHAIYRQANLMVFYLFELEEARTNLEMILPQLSEEEEWANALLLIGDIHLMQQSYADARKAYTQVSEAFNEGDPQIRALAKYKLGQLSYYNGEFNLAQALLSAIKDNTSNDISNDAIQLNLLIIDNTGLDTSTVALEIFAQAQLLSYQRKYNRALDVLDSLAYQYPTHSLADEILWEKVNIFLKRNEITTALAFIDRILEAFPYDLYGDDALYTKARIHDYTLKDQEAAMKYYLEFLSAYPGSLFSVEVRKRIRELRKA